MANVSYLINPTADIYSTEYELDTRQQEIIDDFNARSHHIWMLDSMRADGLRWWRLTLATQHDVFIDDFVLGSLTRTALAYERNEAR